MSDGKRIVDDGGPLERAIVASAGADDEPPAELEARILAALPFAAPIPSAWAGPAGSDEAGGSAGTPWPRRMGIALAALGIGALIAGSIASRSSAPSPLIAPARSPAPPTMPVAVEGRESGESVVAVVTPDALPSAPGSAAASPKLRPSPKAETEPSPKVEEAASPDVESGSTLAREIALLDAVRRKLGDGDRVAALRELDAYDAEFPHGLLRPEATVLRTRTLLAQGRREEAVKLAEDFLAKHPRSVHANRIRALLAD